MSEIKTSVLIVRENMFYSGEIYTTGKTLPPAVTGGKNLTSENALTIQTFCILSCQATALFSFFANLTFL